MSVPLRPATILAWLAVFLLIAGGALAAAKIDSSDLSTAAVTARKIAASAVTAKKIRTGAVTAPKIKPGAVRTGAIADNAVNGAKVDESSLSQVPSAASAENADSTGGLKLQKFSAVPNGGTALTKVATVGSLEIRYGCANDGHPLLSIVPAAGAATQSVRTSVVFNDVNKTEGAGHGTLPPDGLTILDAADAETASDGQIEALTTSGQVTTIQWAARGAFNAIPSANPIPTTCTFYGTGISG